MEQFTIKNEPTKIKLLKCEVCGRDVPDWLGINIGITTNAPALFHSENATIEAVVKAMRPYKVKSYFICMRCVLEKLGVKPVAKNPADFD